MTGEKQFHSQFLRWISLLNISLLIPLFTPLLLNKFMATRDVLTKNRTRFRYLQFTYLIDSPAVFDSTSTAVLWRVMEYDGIPEMVTWVIKTFYQRTSVYIWGIDRPFRIRTGVHQDYVLSSIISNYVINLIMDTSRDVQISPEHSIIDLEYAEGTIFKQLWKKCKKCYCILKTVAKIGLRINTRKTKIFPPCIIGTS